MSEATAFLAQNPIAAESLTAPEVEDYAQHHSGGLIVLAGYAHDGRCVKMHDSWADDGLVIVHVYDPDDPENDNATEDQVFFADGGMALARFLQIVTER